MHEMLTLLKELPLEQTKRIADSSVILMIRSAELTLHRYFGNIEMSSFWVNRRFDLYESRSVAFRSAAEAFYPRTIRA